MKKNELTRSPVFFVLPSGGSRELKIDPPPAKAKWLEEKAVPVVLQLVGTTDFKQSAYVLDSKKQLQLVAYNFGEHPAAGDLTIEGGTTDKSALEIPPGERVTRVVAVDGPGELTVQFNADKSDHAIVAARVVNASP